MIADSVREVINFVKILKDHLNKLDLISSIRIYSDKKLDIKISIFGRFIEILHSADQREKMMFDFVDKQNLSFILRSSLLDDFLL